MLIGIDFDNTIVNYDKIFHKVAVEWGMIPEAIPANKLAVRDFLREAGQEDRWTQMQGYVYGNRMDQAEIYPGLLDFIQRVTKAGHTCAIISHKTQFPYLGPKYDLHAAAHSWIEKNIALDLKNIFFEPTKTKKIERIAELDCDVFIDDLPEIVTSPQFPKRTLAILFDPDSTHHSCTTLKLSSWTKIQQKLEL